MNRQQCLQEMRKDLAELKVDLKKTDFFITHLHADHIGLVSTLSTESSKIYFNKIEAARVKKQDFWARAYSAWLPNGFPENELNRVMEEHPSRRYGPRKDIVFYLCSDGQRITVGDFSLICIQTPGHSPGHMCLYDPDKKILFSGDHLLGDITPNISATGFLKDENPLRDYLVSLDKTSELDVAMVLPGHGSAFSDHRKRAEQIREHHHTRLKEIVSILDGSQPLTAYEVASRMSWEINGQWSHFPVTQKWFATSEALAHLIYLLDQGIVRKEMIEEMWRYSLRLKE